MFSIFRSTIRAGFSLKSTTKEIVHKTLHKNLICTSSSLLEQGPSHKTSPVSLPTVVELTESGKSLILRDGISPKSFHASWLRHNCQCEQCRQPYSGQKLIDSSLLQPSYSIKSANKLSDDVISVTWAEEDHTSIFAVSFLQENDYSDDSLAQKRAETRPTPCPSEVPSISWKSLQGKEGVLEWMRLINEFGVCLVKDVPQEEGEVKRLAELMCPVQNTIYGDVWDVKSDPEPINVAYSDAQLDFHMDLSYYESPPGIQFLHCLRFDDCVEGGESLFADAWNVAETLRLSHPHHFHTLSTVPATFQKIHFTRAKPAHMKYQRPHIVLEPRYGHIVAVNWAPAFEGPLQVPGTDVDAYYEAHRHFAKMLHDSANKMKFRMVEGDLISFNNRRVLHGRNAFRLNGGVRHLRGCYVNIDEFRSSLMVHSRQLDADVIIKHVLNQCCF